MKKQWIWGCIAFVIFISLSSLAIKMANDRAGKKTEFMYVCYIDSGNLMCELSEGGFEHKRVGYETQWLGDVKQTEEGIVFKDVTYDGILPIEYNCWLDFIIDGESITCYLCFHRSEACQDKEWSGDIFLDIKKNGNKCKISPDVTNCKSVELREYVSNTAGQGYYFDVYQ